MEWLVRNFGPGSSTEIKAAGETRLLVLDGHVSHVNAPFCKYCIDHNIVLLCLPPHTTHKLQPLDVGLFSPYKQAYSTELKDRFENHERGVSKANFKNILAVARARAFTSENITSSFDACGIMPLNRRKILKRIKQHRKDIGYESDDSDSVYTHDSGSEPDDNRELDSVGLNHLNSTEELLQPVTPPPVPRTFVRRPSTPTPEFHTMDPEAVASWATPHDTRVGVATGRVTHGLPAGSGRVFGRPSGFGSWLGAQNPSTRLKTTTRPVRSGRETGRDCLFRLPSLPGRQLAST